MKLYRAQWRDDNGIKCYSLPQPRKMLGNLYDQIQDTIDTDSWVEECIGEVSQDEWDNILEQCK